MKAGVYYYPGRTHGPHMQAVISGLQSHGVKVSTFNSQPDDDVDFSVVWGWRVGQRVKSHTGRPVLVAERGYINRMVYTSLGWDGLNGRARFPINSDPSRFSRLFGDQLRPWREGSRGYALLIGQVVGDAQLVGVNIHGWYKRTATALYHLGWDVRFRQHPVEVKRGVTPPFIPFAKLSDGSLEDAMDGAGIVVCYNSNTAVDAVMAGVPVHIEDIGSMVYELGSHDFSIVTSPREWRLAQLANIQWSIPEIASGHAWDAVKDLIFV